MEMCKAIMTKNGKKVFCGKRAIYCHLGTCYCGNHCKSKNRQKIVPDDYPLRRIRRKNGKVISNCDVPITRAVTVGGWDLPESKWANPFPAKHGREDLERYEQHVRENLWDQLPELEGKTLGCFCDELDYNPGAHCHGQVLLRLLNEYHQKKDRPRYSDLSSGRNRAISKDTP